MMDSLKWSFSPLKESERKKGIIARFSEGHPDIMLKMNFNVDQTFFLKIIEEKKIDIYFKLMVF